MRMRSDVLLPMTDREKRLCRVVLEELRRHYPTVEDGWDVSINPGGLLFVRNTLLSGRKGFILHTANLENRLDAVMRAGGELLERFRIQRDQRMTWSRFRDLNRSQARDSLGDLIAEV